MRFTVPRKKITPINLTPLINVIFLLLIFFMVTASMEKMDTLPVTIPVSQEIKNTAPGHITIYITATNQLAIDDQPVNASERADVIRHIFTTHPPDLVSIKADQAASATLVIEILHLLENAGMTEVALLTELS